MTGTPSAGRSTGAPTESRAVPGTATELRAVPGPPRPRPGVLRGAAIVPADADADADADAEADADADADDADSSSDARSGDDPDGSAEASIEPGADTVDGRAAAVERLPLADRADAFAELHDELRTRLEHGGDTRG